MQSGFKLWRWGITSAEKGLDRNGPKEVRDCQPDEEGRFVLKKDLETSWFVHELIEEAILYQVRSKNAVHQHYQRPNALARGEQKSALRPELLTPHLAVTSPAPCLL